MKVKLNRRIGQNPEGSVVDLDQGSAEWLIERAHATPIKEAKTAEQNAEPQDGDHDDLPPRAGKGSGRDAWAAYAEKHGIHFDDDATRDDIIEAVDNHGA